MKPDNFRSNADFISILVKSVSESNYYWKEKFSQIIKISRAIKISYSIKAARK